jgi:hypothetical protein
MEEIETIPMSEEEIWQSVIDKIAQKNPSLAANLLKCRLIKAGYSAIWIAFPDSGFTEKMIMRN